MMTFVCVRCDLMRAEIDPWILQHPGCHVCQSCVKSWPREWIGPVPQPSLTRDSS